MLVRRGGVLQLCTPMHIQLVLGCNVIRGFRRIIVEFTGCTIHWKLIIKHTICCFVNRSLSVVFVNDSFSIAC